MMFLGRSRLFDRSVYLIQAPEIAAVSIPRDPFKSGFACFVTTDETEPPAEAIFAFADKLLRAGCVYVCTWGTDCERWHDIIDEAAIGPDTLAPATQVIMTTWHSGESMADALFYFFSCTVPDESFVNCTNALIICRPSLAPAISEACREWLIVS